MAGHRRSTTSAEQLEEPEWVAALESKNLWHCLAPNSTIAIGSRANTVMLPYGGLYAKRSWFSSDGSKKLVIFTSEPSQPWYRSALKVSAGVALGAAAIAAAPAAIGAGIGVTAAGPVAGGLVATKMAAGGGLAAGGALATAQGVAMGGAGGTAIAGGGVVGGLMSKIGLGRKKGSHCLALPRSDVYICGTNGKVYVGIDVLANHELEVISGVDKSQQSKL